MACAVFVASLVTTGIIASFIPGNNVESHANDRDYHYIHIPYAGDVIDA